MATVELTKTTELGDPTPPVGGHGRGPRTLGKTPRVKNLPQDELGQYLLGMFLLHSSVRSKFSLSSETLDDVGKRLSAMDQSTKRNLLARVERMLGVPRF
jgi:hypothetical protein